MLTIDPNFTSVEMKIKNNFVTPIAIKSHCNRIEYKATKKRILKELADEQQW
jgi:hypothetical protein